MKLSVLDFGLWASSLIGELVLAFVLLRKRRWVTYPYFGLLIALNLAGDCALYPASRLDANTYKHLYWGYYVLNVLLQGAIVWELVKVVLKPTGTWPRDGRKQFFLWGTIGALVALALAYLVAPPAPSLLERLGLRADLFTSLLICELVVVVTVSSVDLGLGWRNHVMVIGQGLTAWATVAVVIDSLHSYFGTSKFFTDTEAIKTLAYVGAVGYWCVQLWHEEPERGDLSPQLRKYIVALHRRVQYDLGEAEQ